MQAREKTPQPKKHMELLRKKYIKSTVISQPDCAN
jgi:hypothetical protein